MNFVATLGKMPDPDSPSCRVTDPEAAIMLVDPTRLRWFAPFLGRTRRVGEVAAELGVSRQAMLYRVRQLVRLGLLCVCGEQPRGGRAIKLYRSRAEQYLVPFTAMPFACLEEQRARLDDPWQKELVRSVAHALYGLARQEQWGMRFYRGPDGTIEGRTEVVDPPGEAGAPAPLSSAGLISVWTTLELDPAQAAQLAHQLSELTRTPPVSGGAPYVLRLALAPLVSKELMI